MTAQAALASVPALNVEPGRIQPRKIPPLRLAIFAEKGVGKTALALTASKPLVIDTNYGLEGEAVPADVDALEWTPDAWEDLNALYFSMKANDRDRNTYVIDQVDTLNSFLLQQSVDTWASATRSSHASMVSIGKAVPEQRDYLAASMALERFLTLLMHSGKDIILLAHTLSPDPLKGEYKRGPALNPASRKKVEEWANVYGELQIVRTKEGVEKRLLSWSPDDPERRAGNRWRSTLGRAMTDPTIPKIKAAIARSYRTATAGKETK